MRAILILPVSRCLLQLSKLFRSRCIFQQYSQSENQHLLPLRLHYIFVSNSSHSNSINFFLFLFLLKNLSYEIVIIVSLLNSLLKVHIYQTYTKIYAVRNVTLHWIFTYLQWTTFYFPSKWILPLCNKWIFTYSNLESGVSYWLHYLNWNIQEKQFSFYRFYTKKKT